MSETTKAWITVITDIICLLGGLAGIAHQELSGQVHPELITLYGMMILKPGASALVSLRGQSQQQSSAQTAPTGTNVQSSGSVSQEQS